MPNPLNLLAQLITSTRTTPAVSETPIQLKALAWARVSTEKQEERGLSIPEQLREIRSYAKTHGIEIIAEYHEAASAFQHPDRRIEFQKMLARARSERGIQIILVHDLSRFGRNSGLARVQIDELRKVGVRVISLNDPDLDPETPAGVYMNAITFAKNEAYSREVAFHTRKGCRSNVQTRDSETGWCFKNGGQPLFGYRAERLNRGEIKRGRPLMKVIWVPDDTSVAGRRIHEWTRYLLLELAARRASLVEMRNFLNRTGIPGRRNQFWGLSTVNALLQPSVLMQYCGYGVWNVRDRQGHERPQSEWVIVENAHQALITADEACRIAEARRIHSSEKRFTAGPPRSRGSNYLLSGGLFKCGRCGANMTGFRTDSGYYYVCGSQPYRSGMGCGPGVYVPQKQVEAQVLQGLDMLLDACADPKSFAKKVNAELRRLSKLQTGAAPETSRKIQEIESRITNIRQAIEQGLQDANWANSRLRELILEKEALEREVRRSTPPQIDVATAFAYRKNTAKLLQHGDITERKRLLRSLVENVKLLPDELEIEIAYRIPGDVMNSVVAGDGFEPPTFGL